MLSRAAAGRGGWRGLRETGDECGTVATIEFRMDDSMSSILIRLFLVLFVVLTNAYFVAAEFAMVSVRRSRIEPLAEEGNKKARIVLRFLDDLNTFISTCQVGVSVAHLVLDSP